MCSTPHYGRWVKWQINSIRKIIISIIRPAAGWFYLGSTQRDRNADPFQGDRNSYTIRKNPPRLWANHAAWNSTTFFVLIFNDITPSVAYYKISISALFSLMICRVIMSENWIFHYLIWSLTRRANCVSRCLNEHTDGWSRAEQTLPANLSGRSLVICLRGTQL